MKFPLGVCASSRSLSAMLANSGHDLLLALDVDPGAPDEALLALALQEGRVLVTENEEIRAKLERQETASFQSLGRSFQVI